MKRFVAIILCLLLTFSVACSENDPTAKENLKTHTGNGYKIYYNGDWIDNVADKGFSIRSAQNSGGISEAVITVAVNDTVLTSSEDYWTEYEKEISGFLSEYKLIRKFSDSALNGKAAVKTEYTGKISGAVCRFGLVACVENGKVYTVLLNSTDEKYTDNTSCFENIVKYFEFTEGKNEESTQTQDKVIESIGGDYRFECPDGWHTERNDGMITVKPQSSNASISVLVYSLPSDKSNVGVYDYWKETYLPDLQETMNEFSLTKEYEKDTEPKLDSVPACRKEYSVKANGKEYKYAQILCVSEGYVYSIVFTAVPEDYDTYVSALDGIIKTFDFIG